MAPGPGGTAPMEHPYKSHTILNHLLANARALRIRSGDPHQQQTSNHRESFKFAQKFETKVEAETYALAAAIRWIDDSTPKLLPKG
jgi:hypothetical protein